MAGRHLSRSIVMQTLFEWDFAQRDPQELEEVLVRNQEEFAPGAGDDVYMHKLLEGIRDKKEKLDDVIKKAAPDWPIEKIAHVDRNILRIGLYELLYGDREDVPPKVAINEAIELAKNFGGEASGKFVNGVLGSVYRELGEPGKDQQSVKKKEIAFEDMEVVKLAGAVVYARHEGLVYLAFVHDIFGHWTLPKKTLQDDMSFEDAALFALESEMGLAGKIGEMLGNNEYISSHPEKGKIRKQVRYFIAQTEYKELKSTDNESGLDDSRWFELEEIVHLNFYEDIFPIVTKAINILVGKE